MNTNVYVVTKTPAGHGGGTTETIGVYRGDREQINAVVAADRKREEKRTVKTWMKWANPTVTLEEFKADAGYDYEVREYTVQELDA
jgi:hypothetical protein